MGILHSVRKIHETLHGKWINQNQAHALKKRLHSAKAFVIGSPVHTNLGDSAIAIAQISFLNRFCLYNGTITEITFPEFYKFREICESHIKNSSPIFGLGGGNMGNQWENEEHFRYALINSFPNSPLMIFPQTIYFLPDSEDDIQTSISYYNGKTGLTLVAREKNSEEIMKSLYPDTTILLTPDIVLSSTMGDYGAVKQKRDGALLCVRSDAEKSIDNAVWDELEQGLIAIGESVTRTDMHSDCAVTKENRRECVRKKMQEFCGAEIVITDRLHGMIFAALTGTPCVVFSNYNHKVKGTYDWISYLPYICYVETEEEAEAAIPKLLSMKDCEFDNTPLLPYFEKLKDFILEK